MSFLLIFFALPLSLDTLKYDDGIPEGFYIVGEYKNDKFGVKFAPPYPHYRVIGVLVFADNTDGFKGASLCPDSGLPDTANPWVELDSVYSDRNKWSFTPIEFEINPTCGGAPIWFVMRVADYPGVGGDTTAPSGNSWYYSDSHGWNPVNYNWLIRFVIQQEPGYYEDFVISPGGYTGNWEFGVPLLIPPPKDNCFGTILNDYYPNNTYLWLESPWIFVSSYGLSQPTLVFKHFYRTELKYDGGNIKISKNDINWQLITPLRGYDVDTLSGAAGIDGEPGFSGNSGIWRNEYFFLPIWDSLKIRWCFGSDPAGTDHGWFIDEVKVGERPPRDVSPIGINFRKIVPPETTIVPSTKVNNLGIYPEGIFQVKCRIESCGIYIYESTQPVFYIDPDSTVAVNFRPWNTKKQGVVYTLEVYTDMPGDEQRFNDTIKTELLTFNLIDYITAGFTTIGPSIDGIIDTMEWEDATILDGSDVLGVDSIDQCGDCSLYFINSFSYLYIGVKADSINEIKIYLDESGDGMWNTDGNEGFYWLTPNSYKFQDMYYHLVYSLPDSLKSVGAQGAEIAIPRGYEPYEIMPTESLRCFIQVNSHIGYVGWWPQYVRLGNYNNPSTYAKIKITGVGVGEKTKIKEQIARIEVYPNPFTKKTVIIVQGLGDWKSDPIIQIYDLGGRLIRTLPIPNPHLPITRICWDATTLPAGFYFLIYKSGNTKITKKITLIH